MLFTSKLATQYVHTMFYIERLKSRSPQKSTTPLFPFFAPSDFWAILCPALKQLVFLNRNILFELIEANVMIQISAQGDDDSDEDVVICNLITNFFIKIQNVYDNFRKKKQRKSYTRSICRSLWQLSELKSIFYKCFPGLFKIIVAQTRNKIVYSFFQMFNPSNS